MFRVTEDSLVDVYNWTGANTCFVWCGRDRVAMGGGKDGFAFILDNDFNTASTYESATFGNPKLAEISPKTLSVQVVDVECWSFVYFK